MKEYFEELFKNTEQWRVESFLNKMKDHKRNCTLNEEESFIKSAIYYAESKLKTFETEPTEADFWDGDESDKSLE